MRDRLRFKVRAKNEVVTALEPVDTLNPVVAVEDKATPWDAVMRQQIQSRPTARQYAVAAYLFCPNLAALSFFHRLNAISLFRRRDRCTECGTCTRVCAMDAVDDDAYGDVSRLECIRCFSCVEKYPADRSRSGYFFQRKIVGSGSRAIVNRYS